MNRGLIRGRRRQIQGRRVPIRGGDAGEASRAATRPHVRCRCDLEGQCGSLSDGAATWSNSATTWSGGAAGNGGGERMRAAGYVGERGERESAGGVGASLLRP